MITMMTLLLVPKLELGNAFALEAPASGLRGARRLPLDLLSGSQGAFEKDDTGEAGASWQVCSQAGAWEQEKAMKKMMKCQKHGPIWSRPVRFPILCVLLLFLVGCASSPSPNFYTLDALSMAVEGTGGPVHDPGEISPGPISVGPVSVPDIVDRPQMVLRMGPNRVAVDEFNRWAEPLYRAIGRVVARNLAAFLKTEQVGLYDDASMASPRYRIVVDVQRFESAPGQGTELDAVWVVRRTADNRSRSGRTTVHEPVSGLPGSGEGAARTFSESSAVESEASTAMVAAHSRALSRLSRDAGMAVLALEREPALE